MRKLILYTLIFIAPFIIVVIGLEILLRKIPNTYMVKADFLSKNSENTQILILGSSHGITGINPDYFAKNAFNTANYAQTLDQDYKILNANQGKLEHLEYIIVPLSYHLLWTTLEDHPQQWRRKYYDIYYNITTEPNPLKRLILEDESIRTDLQIISKYYYNKENPVPELTTMGFVGLKPAKKLAIIEHSSKNAITAHTTNNLNWRYAENVEYLKKIIEIGKHKKAKVILVTIPAHSSFVNHLNQKQLEMMYSVANNLTDNKNVFYYNLINDFNQDADSTNYKLFFDSDHLSYIGAKILSVKLDSIISVLDKN